MAEREDHAKQMRELIYEFENLPEPTDLESRAKYDAWMRKWRRANANIVMHTHHERRGLIIV